MAALASGIPQQMPVDSSVDITALLLGLEERIRLDFRQQLSEQLAAVTTRLDAILPAYARDPSQSFIE